MLPLYTIALENIKSVQIKELQVRMQSNLYQSGITAALD